MDDDEANCESNTLQNTLVLLSGGLDSTACVQYYLDNQHTVQALTIDYGQLAFKQERLAAERIANHYQIRLSMASVSGLPAFQTGYIPGRNLLLLTLALVATQFDRGLIAIGIHAGTSYVDSSERFVREAQRVIDLYADGRILIAAPFLDWSKGEIWAYCAMTGVPTEFTYSCEAGSEPPCGDCPSCKDREALRAR
jgi:7-cyano-7-deazaguanine synthase